MVLWYYGTMVLPVGTVRPDQPSPTIPLARVTRGGESADVALSYLDILQHAVVDSSALILTHQSSKLVERVETAFMAEYLVSPDIQLL